MKKTKPAGEVLAAKQVPHPPSSHPALPRLAAEFPDNADYKSRLAALLKLQDQHFGQKLDATENPEQPK